MGATLFPTEEYVGLYKNITAGVESQNETVDEPINNRKVNKHERKNITYADIVRGRNMNKEYRHQGRD